MNKRVRFTRWRIALKTLKWWGVLCVIVYPLSALLQRYVLHFQYPKDALGYALLTVTFLGPIIAGIFFLLEETVDSIDGQKLQKKRKYRMFCFRNCFPAFHIHAEMLGYIDLKILQKKMHNIFESVHPNLYFRCIYIEKSG